LKARPPSALRAVREFTRPVSGLTSGPLVLAVAPSRETSLDDCRTFRSGSGPVTLGQGLRLDSITVAGAAPDWTCY